MSGSRSQVDNTDTHSQNYYILSDSIGTENRFYSQIYSDNPNSK